MIDIEQHNLWPTTSESLPTPAAPSVMERSSTTREFDRSALPAVNVASVPQRSPLLQLDIAGILHQEKAPTITGKHKARTDKARLGQFMTPATVARFMASLFPPSPLQTCRLPQPLDDGWFWLRVRRSDRLRSGRSLAGPPCTASGQIQPRHIPHRRRRLYPTGHCPRPTEPGLHPCDPQSALQEDHPAFPNRTVMGRYLGKIAWETEVWVADASSHLIHFNGVRFLGPYPNA